MHGLLAYGVATGGLSSDATLLFNTLGDFLEAKSDGDRVSAQKAVDLILQHGNLGDRNDEAGPDDRILAEFESISDPEERSRFYQRHRAELMKAHDVRQSPSS